MKMPLSGMRPMEAMMAKFEDKERHPSFGMISWSRQHTTGMGGGAKLFGSDLRHSNLISLKIYEAERQRDLSRTWYFAHKMVAEVIMSQHQFSEFLCSPNQGDGVPCTIRHTTEQRGIEYPEDAKTEGELHNEEFQERLKTIKQKGKAIRHRIIEMDKGGAVKKGDFRELAAQVENLIMEISSNVPFITESFDKSMERTVAAGKAEIEAYVQHKITSAGLAALGAEPPELLEKKGDSYAKKEDSTE